MFRRSAVLREWGSGVGELGRPATNPSLVALSGEPSVVHVGDEYRWGQRPEHSFSHSWRPGAKGCGGPGVTEFLCGV